ncbi:MAG TPA: c-type cytochrome [Verrucomicrobiae bacterium]|nr:c-type cytochrome [Verrucomicrobiae bacterium]
MKKIFFQFAPILAGFAALIAGCKPAGGGSSAAPKTSTPSSATAAQITFSSLPVPPEPAVTPDFIARGKTIYQQNCVACHGVNGDGKGDAAAFLVPKPRNFVEANYRLRSTPNGHLPTDADLFRAISLGMPGTPMPAWKHILSDDDRWALVEYLKTFSPRFANSNEDRAAIVSIGNPPARNESAIAEGKALFTKLSCVTCHGESGRGDGPSSINLVDDSHMKISPRDFTRPAAFKSGYAAKEIVRTILTGFNGTPMLGFNGTVSEQDAWKVAYYVETFAKSAPPVAIARASQGFSEAEKLGEPDVRIRVTERAWKYDPAVIRVKRGQIVEITFEPTDNGLGAGHGFAISSYDEMVFLNGAMVGTPKTAKFRADRAGKFTYYCATQCSTEKLHPQMNGTLIVEDDAAKQTVSTK